MTDRFFRKPIVLISAIVVLSQAVAKLVLSLFGVSMLSEIEGARLYHIDVFEIFMGAVLLLFYIFSNRNMRLSFPASFFRAASIAELVVVILLMCCGVLAVFFILVIGTLSLGIFMLRFFPLMMITAAVAMVIIAISVTVFVSVILLFISQTAFSVSLKRSVTDNQPRRGTAIFFAVMNFIIAALFLASAVILILLNKPSVLGLILDFLISTPSCILIGLMSAKYAAEARKAAV